MSPNIACGPVKVFTTPIFTVCAAAVLASTQANANAAMRFISLLHDRQHQRRRIFRTVVERVLADLVRLVVMRPEDIGDRRIAVRDFQTNAVALLEAESVRLDADFEAIHLAGLERLGLR